MKMHPDHDASAQLTNAGTMVNNGTITGTVTNTGTIYNSGSLPGQVGGTVHQAPYIEVIGGSGSGMYRTANPSPLRLTLLGKTRFSPAGPFSWAALTESI